jgi:hypothetical protein
MQYARIANGAIAEIIEGTDVPIAERFHPSIVATLVAIPDGSASTDGWSYANGEFVPPVAPTVPIPSITARQLRLWLLSQDRALADVDAAIDALPVEHREAARVEWEYSTAYERTHPLIESIGVALGFDDVEIDAGFIAAAAL